MGVLVAGGTGALGAAVVRELQASGYEVTVTSRSAAGPGAVQADLLDPASAREAVEGVGDLEAVVNVVGGFTSGPLVGDADLESFEGMLRRNLVPAFNLARAAMPLLAARGSGSFVCVSSRAALEPFPGAAGYVTAKAGVLAFVRALHAEYGKAGVRSNAIVPEIIDTPVNRKAMPDADRTNWTDPAEIARVVRFLVSDDSAVTSGAAVPVYGRA